MKRNRPVCPKCECGKTYVRVDMSLTCSRCGYVLRRIEMVTKEHSDYYRLLGHYRFQSLITGDTIFTNGYSKPTTAKECWEKLPILREQAIDYALNLIAICPLINRKECKSEWVLIEIFDEEWSKYES